MSVNEDLINEIDENLFINLFSKGLPRSNRSINRTHECDAEIIDISSSSKYLAATTDQVSEEISAGLYRDPYLMGWMSVVVNLSDLAAVGAEPIGLLLSTTLSPDWEKDTIEKIIKGMHDACEHHGCGILGGDLNTGEPSLGATALGFVDRNLYMKRIGMNDGDAIYITGPVGMGGAFAFVAVAMEDRIDQFPYRPVARLKEAKIISRYATSCMDTSDGIIFTLDQLSRLNSASLKISSVKGMVHTKVLELSKIMNLPPLAILAAIHGEFELCFTIPEEKDSDFINEMNASGFSPLKIGHVCRICNPGVVIEGKHFPSGEIRNLWTKSESTGDYIKNVINLINSFYSRNQ